MLFASRDRNRSRAHLEWRVRAFGTGAVLAVLGIALDRDWLVLLAIAVLVVGFVLRFLRPREEQGPAEPHSADDVSEEEPDDA